MCLAQGPQRSDAGEARTRDPWVSSQALYHLATALREWLHEEELSAQGLVALCFGVARAVVQFLLRNARLFCSLVYMDILREVVCSQGFRKEVKRHLFQRIKGIYFRGIKGKF